MSTANFANLIGVIGAAMGGYTQGKRQREHDDLDKQERQQAQELRGLQIEEAKQKRQNSKDLDQAGQQIPVQMNAPGDGMGPTAFIGGNDSFGTKQAADQTLNSPKAVMGRQRVVLDRTDPAGASGRALADTQQQVADLGLDEAQRKHVNQMFDDSISHMASHTDIAKAVSDSKHDGMGGGLTVQPIVSPDGKTVQYRQVLEDGSVAPAGPEFSNSADGVLQAKVYLSKNMSLADKMNHMHQAHQDKISQQNADTNEQYRRDLVGMKEREISAKASKDDPYERMDEVDRLAFQQLNAHVTKINEAIIKAQAEGSWDESSPNAKALRESIVVAQNKANAIWTSYSKKGQPASDPFGLRGPGTSDDSQAPSFDVKGDPATFRRKLAASTSPNRDAVLAAFDARYPSKEGGAGKSVGKAAMGEYSTPEGRNKMLKQASQSRPAVDLKKVVKAQMGQGFTADDLEGLASFNR